MIYLHVPFCKSFCTYCDFYSEVSDCFSDYARAVREEVKARKEELSMNISSWPSADTLYIGGGTPSVLPLDVLKGIVSAIEDCRPAGGQWKEFTVEVNPEDIVEKGNEYVSGLLGLGVSRISMGVQSFDDGILRWMNRRHDAAGALKAYEMLRRFDVDISIDLIFGISQLSDELWERTLDKAIALRPEHISAYQLSIEEGSALASMVASGKYAEASDEQCRRQYDILCGKLGAAGYIHYEISNFALPGHEALHNSHYWDRTPYVGLGPGAHSLRRSPDVRSWNEQKLPRRRQDGSLETYSSDSEILTAEDIRVEEIMLPLRTSHGMEVGKLFTLADKSVIAKLVDEGGMEIDGSRIRIREDHFFTSDEILRELV